MCSFPNFLHNLDLFTSNVNIIWTVYNFWNIYISLKRVSRDGFYNRHRGSKAWTIKQCLYFKQRADGFPICFFVDLKRQGISGVLHVFYVIFGQITLKFYGDDFIMSLNDFGCFESHVSMKQVCSTMGGVSCPYSLRPSSYSSSTSTVTQRCRDARDMTHPSTIYEF